ncbi:calmodulin-binding protein 60 G-like [Amaranthus tricolor]|uniref:calmodulin-binding protein 60 G-like n=1 Tax=Amaranthus tricolor TaxID=29722 RepID=UPI00258889A8|nr:calmodulin-binding protein 60 G-like [Amaranthus tricolor]
MVLKKGFPGKDENGNPQFRANQRNQRLKLSKCVCKEKLWFQAYSVQLENLIRKAVREEVQQVIQHSLPSISRSLPSQAKPSEPRKFKLQFEGTLPTKLFTVNKLDSEGSSAIKLFLLDAITGHRVTTGPLSSIKVKLFVLHGHFKAEELEDWTKHDFEKNVVFERDGKRPLLVGRDVVITLHNGIGCIGDVCFTDNSSWERSKMFRLGAMAEANGSHVREAVSNPFKVKDRRGENYQKRKIPSPEDDVWRLRWIAKDGKICKRLAEHQIYKVKDFVTQYYLDESLLRQILNVAPKKWDAIVQCATSCLSGNSSSNLNDLASPNIPGFDSQQFFVPPVYHDQPEIQMLDSNTEGHNYQLDGSMAMNSPFLMDLLAGSCSEHANFSLHDFTHPSLPTMLGFETSSWIPVAEPKGEQNNGFFYRIKL